MSPRPRRSSDDDLLAATGRVVARLGPHLTLADVAREAGVSAAMLVQRFGSKRELLLAFASIASRATAAQFEEIRAGHADPIEGVRAVVRCYARMAPTPEALSNALAFLQVDLRDPDFHRHAYLQARETLDALRRLLDAAVRAGRLDRTDTRKLARALNAVISGSMISWGVLREGTAEAWMMADVETLLRPLLRTPKTRASARPSRATSAARRSG